MAVHRESSLVNVSKTTNNQPDHKRSLYTLCRANHPQVRQPIKVVRKRMVVKSRSHWHRLLHQWARSEMHPTTQENTNAPAKGGGRNKVI